MNNELTSRIQALVAEALHIPMEDVKSDLAFGDIPQWDSMGHMNVIMLLEEKFSVPLSAESIGTLTSIPDICKYIEDHGDKS